MRIENKKAYFDYEVVEKFEAGLVLSGAEVKSIRMGGTSLMGARVVPTGGELFVIGMNVPKYAFSSDENYEAGRRRKILLSKREMLQIESKRQSFGLTLVPLAVYNKGSFLKMEIGLVRVKKKYEKREVLKKRDEKMDIARMLK